jgi:hypothetical protein
MAVPHRRTAPHYDGLAASIDGGGVLPHGREN